MIDKAATSADPHAAQPPPPLTITVSLPDRRLCGNGRINPLARTRLIKAQRTEAMYAAREAILQRTGATDSGAYFLASSEAGLSRAVSRGGATGRVRVSALIHRPTWWATRALDDDNLWRGLKATLDGFQDALVVRNDRQFQLGDVRWEKATPTAGRVVLTLTAIPDPPRQLSLKEG